ncbi:polysaccharide deacetylase family protein [Plastoroseomonas arctica]|uniref:NodB homology domain-containing protein n=1 Tax=Plastoroseomonas arctica TaxID=1509237 RepID=A0AAF1JWP9_9PROT|nr:hypothetical protein [Plastoroseomonas arctica]MBR0655432.1 hypothetical protein [Plastoroseomonas arctica]
MKAYRGFESHPIRQSNLLLEEFYSRPITPSELGPVHVGWSRRGFDTRCGDAARLLARSTQRLREGDIILLHDGGAARDARGEPVCLAVLEALLPMLAARGLACIRLERDALPRAPARQQPR